MGHPRIYLCKTGKYLYQSPYFVKLISHPNSLSLNAAPQMSFSDPLFRAKGVKYKSAEENRLNRLKMLNYCLFLIFQSQINTVINYGPWSDRTHFFLDLVNFDQFQTQVRTSQNEIKIYLDRNVYIYRGNIDRGRPWANTKKTVKTL